MLGLLRTILSLIVFLSHMPGTEIRVNIGVMAVILFYFISGFLMTNSFDAFRRSSKRPILSFLADRFLRIYPCYLVVLLAMTGIMVMFRQSLVHATYLDVTTSSFLDNLSLVPLNYFPNLYVHPTWSLALECQFYLLVPILYFLPLPALAAVMAGSMGYHVYAYHAFDIFVADQQAYRHIFGILFVFCMGICFARRADRRWRALLAAIVGAQAVLLLFVYPVSHPFGNFAALEISLAVLIATPLSDYALRVQMPRFKKLDRFIGELCYPIFLVHVPAIYCADILVPTAAVPPKLWYPVAIALCLAFALALHFAVQMPSERLRYAVRGFGTIAKKTDGQAADELAPA